MTSPDVPTLLSVLTRDRLVDIGRSVGVSVPATAKKERQIEALSTSGELEFVSLLSALRRDELKAACRALDIDDSGRARPLLARRLLDARGESGDAPAEIFRPREERRHVPRPGDVVRVRHRQYLVETVTPPARSWSKGGPVAAHRVRLVGLDDDAQGRPLEVLWELELGARVLQSESHGLGSPEGLDPPRRFAAYLAALRWHAVTATDAKLFQAPFRAGIQLMNHQLVPLERALELPRANLFVADDVGLGKTIEAGLVLQELRLRQRVDFVLVVCPAAICLQWRDELWRRFGLHFEVMSRDFVARRRQERGFGVNPWATHQRFVVSHTLLRRPEYRDPLLQRLDHLAGGGASIRAKKSLLILDEAHVAAPAVASRYAVDSRITTVIRDVAPRFENRLFLSATPHNGHSNSFSALLELLDPQRFTRGVTVSAAERDRVMVRRLKSDLKAIQVEQKLPNRHVVRLELDHRDGSWIATEHDSLSAEQEEPAGCQRSQHEEPGHPRFQLGEAEPFEIELAEKLDRYSAAARGQKGGRRRATRLVLVRLQQRLLSSVEAFARTLDLHARHVAERTDGAGEARLPLRATAAEDEDDADVHGLDDDEIEARDAARMAATSRRLESPSAEAREILAEMQELAGRYRSAPDAKARAILDWIRRCQCPAARFGGAAEASAEERRWTDRRLIVFTEYGDTLNHLVRLFGTAFDGTDRGSERLLVFRGGLGDARRRAWSSATAASTALSNPPTTSGAAISSIPNVPRTGCSIPWCARSTSSRSSWAPWGR